MVIADSRSELTRFAGNEIHQSVAERYRHIRVRLIDGGRTGVGEVRGHGDRAVALAFDAAEQSRRVTSASEVSPLPVRRPGWRRSRRIRGVDRRSDAAGSRGARVNHHGSRGRARRQRVRRAEHHDDNHRDHHQRGAAQSGDVDAGEPRVGRARRQRRWLCVAALSGHRRSRRRRSRRRGRGHVRAQPERDGDRARRLRGHSLAVCGDRPAGTPCVGGIQRACVAGAPQLHAPRREAHERADHHSRRRAHARHLPIPVRRRGSVDATGDAHRSRCLRRRRLRHADGAAGRGRVDRPFAAAAEHVGTAPTTRRDGCRRHALDGDGAVRLARARTSPGSGTCAMCIRCAR